MKYNIHINDNISQIRREYTNSKLRRYDLTNEPVHLFKRWLQEAIKAKISDPTTMCLATVDHLNQPHQRLVLLKKIDQKKIIFFTNLNSKKAMQIRCNPRVSVCFPWYALDRQVLILGNVSKLSKIEAIKYFYTRPRCSQISAWASYQSKKIKSKKIINEKFLKFKKKFINKKIPIPNFWGGYEIYFDIIEFWQGRRNRLHDRFFYQKKNGKWYVNRLAP